MRVSIDNIFILGWSNPLKGTENELRIRKKKGEGVKESSVLISAIKQKMEEPIYALFSFHIPLLLKKKDPVSSGQKLHFTSWSVLLLCSEDIFFGPKQVALFFI